MISVFYTTRISVYCAHYKIFRAKMLRFLARMEKITYVHDSGKNGEIAYVY